MSRDLKLSSVSQCSTIQPRATSTLARVDFRCALKPSSSSCSCLVSWMRQTAVAVGSTSSWETLNEGRIKVVVIPGEVRASRRNSSLGAVQIVKETNALLMY